MAVADLNGEGAEATAAEIAATTGQRAIGIRVDITDEAQVEAMVAQVMETFGRLDVVVSNAGILIAEAIWDFPAEKWRAVMNVNLFGYMLVAKHTARVMIEQKSGAIIQINSQVGQEGQFQKLGLCGQQVRRHRPDPDARARPG